ncbi:ATP-binding protein [Larkinella sp. GY13]|uniref:ATP-binding protein n=1 Tax=Larkinella sp. GY13 TaxID=3453720 RepID=UPI003EEEB307
MNRTCAIQRWKQTDGRYLAVHDTLQSNLFVIRIDHIPQLSRDDDATYLEDLLQGQKVFLETINNLFLSNEAYEKAFLELRLVNEPNDRIIRAYIIVNIITKKSVYLSPEERKRVQSQLNRLIPEGYGFTVLTSPPTAGAMNGTQEIDQLSEWKSGHAFEIGRSLFPIHLGATSFGSTPELLELEHDRKREAEKYSHFILPAHEVSMPDATTNFSHFYRSLQNAQASVQVRFSITTELVDESERNLANHFQTNGQEYYDAHRQLSGAPALSCFSKYQSNDQLYSLKVQVFSADETAASFIAHALNAILSQSGDGERATFHCRSITHMVRPEEINEFKQFFYPDYYESLLRKWTRQEKANDLLKFFISRMPHLCSPNEVFCQFRLPYAPSSGLPGIPSRIIKPFYQPNLQPDRPTEDEIGNRKIELGHIISASSTDRTANPVPYHIPVRDLTKHGLIVGMTGSGKTNTTLMLIQQLIEHGIDFCLIEPVKTEYADKLKEIYNHYHRNTGKKLLKFDLKNPLLGDGTPNPEFLRFNPFVGEPKISTRKHLAYIRGAIMAAFPIHGIAGQILKDCLYEFFKASRLRTGKINQKNFKTLKNVDSLSADQLKLRKEWRTNGSKGPLKDDQYTIMSNTVPLRLVRGLSDKEFFDPAKALSFYAPAEDGTPSKRVQTDRTMISFYNFISDYIDGQNWDAKFKQEIHGVLTRRIASLTKDLFGEIFCPELWSAKPNDPTIQDTIASITGGHSCIIELDEVPENEEKALLMAFLLTYLYESRTNRPSNDPASPYHITLIEEAHRLLKRSAQSVVSSEEGASQGSAGKAVSLFTDMLAEIRAKKEGIFIIEQSPSELVADVIKNTNLKIMHKLQDKLDRDYLGNSMNMDDRQKQFASTLNPGEALIFDGQLVNPLLVQIKQFNQSANPTQTPK